jgi:hypothetical protein
VSKQNIENVTKRDIPPLMLRAAVRPGSIDVEKRTAEIIWTTGARGLRGFYDKYFEELSLDPSNVRLERLNNGAPFLNAHNGYDLAAVIGVVESARISGGQGVAVVRFAKAEDDPEADKIFRKVQDGILQNISVGYKVYRYEITEKVGEIPVYRATDWEPFELSIVPMGFDDGAGFRSADRAPNTCEIVSRIAQEKTMTDEETKTAEAQKRAADDKAKQELKDKETREAGAISERERTNQILQAVRTAKLEPSFGEELVKSGVTIDVARAQIIDKLAENDKTKTRSHVPAIEAGEDEKDKFLRGASDWIVTKAGVSDRVIEAGKARGDTVKVDAGEFRGLTLVDIARMSLERAGINTKGMDKVRMVGLALTHRAGYQSTSDFAVLLENTLHKVLLAAYGVTPDTWSRFCAVGSVSDFRAHNRYEMGTFGSLDSLTEAGEFKNKAIPDAVKELITASTKGNIIGLSRQAIINDDMSAFSRLAGMVGRAAKLSIEMDVYTLLALNTGAGPTLTDGSAMFHANHNNISTGAALSAAAIDADRVKLASQKDLSGNEILDLRPAVLLVPISLGGTARVINNSEYDPDTVANKSQMKPNLVRGLFRDVVDTARLTGTRRYIFADPSIAPVIEVAFLDGQREPYLESQEGWRVDGTEWKVRMDYAVGGIGYRGAVTNAGA